MIPTIGVLVAVWQVLARQVTWLDFILFLVFYVATMAGITAGFHRHFAHDAFRANTLVRLGLGILGSMAMQGALFRWVAFHRRHHQHSDDDGDPHSPLAPRPVLGAIGAFWHAHLGWLLREEEAAPAAVRDLQRDPVAVWISRWFLLWAALGLILPATIGWWWDGGAAGAWRAFIWGGLARVCVAHHMTWCINSVCHLWGSRMFEGRDGSRNNLFCAIFTLGEGWHNNHHAFPSVARHGLTHWQIDPTWWLICLLEKCGLASRVKRPSTARLT